MESNYNEKETNLDFINTELLNNRDSNSKIFPLTKKKSSIKDDMNDLKKYLKDEEDGLQNNKNECQFLINNSNKEILNLSNISFSVHFFNLIGEMINNIFKNTYNSLSNGSKFDTMSKDLTFRILKSKSYLLRILINIFNDSWAGNESIISRNKISLIKKYSKIKHNFCFYVLLFEKSKETLFFIIDKIFINKVNSDFDKYVEKEIDKYNAERIELINIPLSEFCICGFDENGDKKCFCTLNNSFDNCICQNKTFKIKSFSRIEYKEITNSLNKEFITISENKSNESLSTIDQIRSISNKLKEKK